MSIVKMMYNPRFTGIHYSPKEMRLPKSCISFGKECIVEYPMKSNVQNYAKLVDGF